MSYEDEMNQLVEIRLKNKEDFLMVKETLTRIGVASKHQKKLFQSCHILCKQKTRYFIVHFKELFMLDHKKTDFTENDKARRNTICNLLASWGIIELVNPKNTETPTVPLKEIRIIPYVDKHQWQLVAKYTIGTKKSSFNSKE